MKIGCLVVCFAMMIFAAVPAVDAAEDTAAWKAELQAFLGDASSVLEVPGAVVVVVSRKEGVAVLTHGVECVDGADPVTAKTSFGIGSLSKAFTATAAAALVGEGLIDWDSKVKASIPEFELTDPMAAERMTLRDLLAHRGGLANHNLVHLNIDADTAWLLPRLGLMEPAGDFRDRFIYSSIGYILAGEVLGRVAGSSWQEVVSQKLLEPLGMDSTTVGPPPEDVAPAACGYLKWGGSMTTVEPISLSVGAPGMGLYSTAEDYARWLELLLGEGEFQGRRVVDAQAFRETWTPQNVIRRFGPGLRAHGFGWYLSSWRGRTLLIHDGGGWGFTSSNRIYPDAGVAIAVFANRSVSALPDVVAERAAELVLGEAETENMLDGAAAMSARIEAMHASTAERLLATRDAEAPPSLDLPEYAGCYEHPVFGRLEISVDGGAMAASLHGVGHAIQHLHDDVFMLSSPYTGDNETTFKVDDGAVVSVTLVLGSPASDRVFARNGESCTGMQ